MNVLVIGSGGREHAIAWKLASSPRAARVFVAPGNAGTAREPGVTNVPVTAIPELVAFARENDVGLTGVGPEAITPESLEAGDRIDVEYLFNQFIKVTRLPSA